MFSTCFKSVQFVLPPRWCTGVSGTRQKRSRLEFSQKKQFQEYCLWVLFSACHIVGITITTTKHLESYKETDESLLKRKAKKKNDKKSTRKFGWQKVPKGAAWLLSHFNRRVGDVVMFVEYISLTTTVSLERMFEEQPPEWHILNVSGKTPCF